jgi:hypothetical protein
MDVVNERSTWISTIAFTDENGAAVTPTSARYKIEDVDSGTLVRAFTDISRLSTSVEITWTSDDTEILDTTKPYETRKLTVWWVWSGGQASEQSYLNIQNIGGVTATSPA